MNGHDRSQHRVVFGALIILVGILALLDNMHLFDARQVIHFWPMVFVVFGVLRIYQARDAAGYVIGAILIAVGVMLTLKYMGVIAFRWRDWWPLFLIAAGLLVLFNGVSGGRAGKSMVPVETTATRESEIDVGALLSGIHMANDTQDFRGGKVSAIAGGAEIDLRHASIQSGATLSIFVLLGGIQIRVPNDWSVVSNCAPLMGGVDDKTLPPANPSKRLVIHGNVIMGGVEIKN
jgi:predicted membrane protein